MDVLGLEDALKRVNAETLPLFFAEAHKLVDRLEAIVDRLAGLQFVAVLPPAKTGSGGVA